MLIGRLVNRNQSQRRDKAKRRFMNGSKSAGALFLVVETSTQGHTLVTKQTDEAEAAEAAARLAALLLICLTISSEDKAQVGATAKVASHPNEVVEAAN